VGVALKVCGLTRRADLELCIEMGVDAVGLNFWPRSKRALSLAEAEGLLRALDRKETKIIGVFVEASAGTVAGMVHSFGLDGVQLHGDQVWQDFSEVGAPLVRVIRGTPAIAELTVPAPGPAWTILDAAVEGYGGKGHKTDWEWAASAVKRLAPAPVWLAGGIRPSNAAQAIEQVNPSGLDVASGAELEGATRGEKDPAKIEALLAACRA
jgi:phosphoribosylanthranilate isomerase